MTTYKRDYMNGTQINLKYLSGHFINFCLKECLSCAHIREIIASRWLILILRKSYWEDPLTVTWINEVSFFLIYGSNFAVYTSSVYLFMYLHDYKGFKVTVSVLSYFAFDFCVTIECHANGQIHGNQYSWARDFEINYD